jgi:hypothetical protein
MAYDKTIWKNRQGTGLNRFRITAETGGIVYLTNEPEAITEPGTQFSDENMNNLEEGVYSAHEAIENHKKDSQAYVVNATIKREEMGAPDGVATLDESGQIPANQLPNLGQGILAVATNDTLQGSGTSQNPLKIKPLNSAIIYSAQDNLENDLRALYRGTWKRITNPAPAALQAGNVESVTLQGSEGQTISSNEPPAHSTLTVSAAYNNSSTGTIDRGNTINNITYREITIGAATTCRSNTGYFSLTSSIKGLIIQKQETGGGVTFPSVAVVPGEILTITHSFELKNTLSKGRPKKNKLVAPKTKDRK